jgi:RHS repeat-associated protein
MLARTTGYNSTSGAWSTHDYYHADGNGNITYLETTNQTLAASYRYDPYGDTIASAGTQAAANLYRFSSKQIHLDSGMYYYLYRFYDPGLQRWLNRDPIAERGGLNLYTFVYNAPLAWVHPDGSQLFIGLPQIAEPIEELPIIRVLPAPEPPPIQPIAPAPSPQPPVPLTPPTSGPNANGNNKPGSNPNQKPAPNNGPNCKKSKCDQEWSDARDWCRQQLAKPPYARSIFVGGYNNVDDCARGLVSAECGGNPVAPKAKPTRRPAFYGK